MEYETGWHSTGFGLVSDTQPDTATYLMMTASGAYERWHANGSVDVYAYSDGSTNYPRRIFLSQQLDPTGNPVNYSYQTLTNGTVQLLQVGDAIDQVTVLTHGDPTDPLKVTQITDPFGRSAILGYTWTNGLERLTSITDPVQIVSQFTYASNFISALTTPYGTTTFTYTETNSTPTLMATDPLGMTEVVQYRNYAALPGVSVPVGVTGDAWDVNFRNTYYWSKSAWANYPNDPTKAQITHWALINGVVSDVPLYTKSALENGVFFNYPGQSSFAGAGISWFHPTVSARILDDGTSQINRFSYDAYGNATTVVDALGRTTILTYAANGVDLLSVQRKTGANSVDTLASFVYNTQHLPVVSVVANVTNALGYNPAGQLVNATNGLGQVATLAYDQNGYLTNITGNEPSATLGLAYDSAGRVSAVTDSDGYTVNYSYDNLNRVTTTAFPDGTSQTAVYGNLDEIAEKGRDGQWAYTTFDALRHLSDVQDPAGNLTHFDWCACGALGAITDPKGQGTTWVRDAQSRVTQKFYPDFSIVNTTYESTTSRLKQVLDAAGKAVALSYNNDDTPQVQSFSGGPSTPSVTNTYDTNYSRLTKLVDGIGTNLFTYVPAAQPGAGSLASWDGPLPNDTISYGYDVLGRVQSIQVGGVGASVLRDDLGRIYWSSNALGATTITYDGATPRPLTITQPNGIITVLGYTAVSDGSRLQTILHTNANGLILSLGYVYDVLGRITQMTETRTNSVSAWAYEYDLTGQLTAATQRDGNGAVLHHYVYAYDAAGNRISEQIDATVATETPNVANQVTSRTGGGSVRVAGFISTTGNVAIAGSPARMLTTTNFVGQLSTSIGTNSFPVVATDISGNSTTNWYQLTVSANGLDTQFTYDLAGNQLTKSNSAGVLALGWDSADRCTAITNGSLRTAIAYDGISRWSRITEYSNATLTADRRLIWNGTTLAEERDASGSNVVQRFFANGFQRTGTNYFYVKDQLGSIIEVTDASGNMVASFSYDPYGRRTQTYGTLWVDFGFAGLVHHKASGTAWAMRRIDQPDVARWANRDPILEEGGLNLYRYCANDPVNKFDPLGLAETNVINLFPVSDTFLNGGAEHLHVADPNTLVMAAHAHLNRWDRSPYLEAPATTVADMNPHQLAAYIRQTPQWKSGGYTSITLVSCNTGVAGFSGVSYAQRLSNLLNITVYAPNGRISFAASENGTTSTYIDNPIIHHFWPFTPGDQETLP